jgi:RNA polymerase sigma-70 factor (ECF subfamily)
VDRSADALLVAQLRAGSEEAARVLFRRHWPAVWRAAYALTGRRSLADEIAQETFVRALAALGRVDADRPLTPWLRRVAVNRALDVLRSERRIAGPSEDDEELAPTGWDEPVPERAEIAAAVLRLSEDKRIVLVLRFWLDYSLEQIAEFLDVPPGTVASRLSRALRDLRTTLGAVRVDE